MSAQDALNFIGDVNSVSVRYPQGPDTSKQITAKVSTTSGMFTVEIRNSSGKIMPNEIKLRVNKFSISESKLTVPSTSLNKNEIMIMKRFIFESLLFEELTKSDKKEIEKISRKQAKQEIDRVVGNDLAKTIQDEIKKSLKNKVTKQEIADISKSVLKKLYRELAVSYTPLIDRLKL